MGYKLYYQYIIWHNICILCLKVYGNNYGIINYCLNENPVRDGFGFLFKIRMQSRLIENL